MSETIYELGDVAVLNVTFSVDGTPTDPTTVTLTIRKPDGSTTDYTGGQLVHDSAGVYHVAVDCDQPGDWTYRFVGTGAAADVETGIFYVKPDPTAADPYGRDLCTLRDVFRLVPGFDPDEVDADGNENGEIVETIANLISSESQSIYKETGREFVAITGADPRIFDVSASVCRRRSMPIGDAAAITQVELFDFDGVTSLGVVDPNLYILEPRLREDWRPITRIRFPYRPGTILRLAPGRTLEITGSWGFPLIPADLRQACAKRVLLRYVADSANAGTRLADALDDTFSIGALLRSSKEVVKSYSAGPFA
jgi:hypothetical protein